MARVSKNFVYNNSVNVYKDALETAEMAGITLSGLAIELAGTVAPGSQEVRLQFYSLPELKLFERARRRQLGVGAVGLFISNFDEHYILDGADKEYGITEAIYCDGSDGNPEGHIVYFIDEMALVEFVTTMASGY